MSTLVIAEHDNQENKAQTLVAIAAAEAIGNEIHVLVAGSGAEGVAAQVSACPAVSKVLLADNAVYEHQTAENLAGLILELADGYSHIVAPHTANGKSMLPRVAAQLGVAQISDIIAVDSPDTFKRPIYAGNAIATVKANDSVKVVSVRGTAYDPAAKEGGSATVESVSNVVDTGLCSFISEEVAESERPELTAAGVIISGGRGMQNGDNFSLLDGIADKLGAAIGASRAAVDAGFVPNDMQVGQTGKIVAPDLYIAVGISGAIQHLAGMKDSKVIVAINKDEDAPIFQVADYGLVADLFQALPELETAL